MKRIVPIGSIAALLVGCSGAPTAGEEATTVDPSEESASNEMKASTAASRYSDPALEDHPPAAVTIELENGNVVEIYDFADVPLVVESGVAGVTPALPELKHLVKQNRLVELFSALRPDLRVPSKVATLERAFAEKARLHSDDPPQIREELRAADQGMAASRDGAGLTAPDVGGQRFGEGPGLQTKQLIGCNNGCCDPVWTAQEPCAHGNPVDYSWFLFNYGWSYANGSGALIVDTATCAAIGTSTFTVSISDGSGGTWSVLEAHYKTFWWGAWFYNRSYSSTVNTASNQHLHTHCGYIDSGGI